MCISIINTRLLSVPQIFYVILLMRGCPLLFSNGYEVKETAEMNRRNKRARESDSYLQTTCTDNCTATHHVAEITELILTYKTLHTRTECPFVQLLHAHMFLKKRKSLSSCSIFAIDAASRFHRVSSRLCGLSSSGSIHQEIMWKLCGIALCRILFVTSFMVIFNSSHFFLSVSVARALFLSATSFRHLTHFISI